MTRPIHRIYQPDGSFVDQPYTDEEMAQLEKDKIFLQEIKDAEVAKEAQRLATQAKLEALGLDEDDLKALGL